MKRHFVGMSGVLTVALACGDSSGPGKQAASVTGIAGDNQSASTGAQLAFPLSFTALGSDGLPVQDVSVSWSVTPTGRATFTPRTSTTDVNGVASTTVRAGNIAGSITIQATVPGVSPVIFHATVLDPCVPAAYTLGDTVSGALTTSDCNRLGQGWFYDYYSLALPAGQQSVRITMHADTLDTYLDLWRDDGPHIAFDDDSILGQSGARNSQLDIIVPGDTFIVGVSSYDRFATFPSYTFAAVPRPARMNGCREVWVVRGVTVSDSIQASDCADSSATPRHYDVARIIVFSGTVLTITQRSTTINPSLALYQPNYGQTFTRTLLASNDDSLPGSNTNAFIRYAVSTNSVFDILIGTSAGGETGDYTFEVSASTTLSPRISGPLSPGRGRWWRDSGLLKRSKL